MRFAWILAAGGGGSSGFGGGGGGGGGGGSSYGGSGGSGGGSLSPGLFAAIVVVALLFIFVPAWFKIARRRAATREQEARAARIVPAAAEAVEDDAHFAVDVVEAAGDRLFRELQSAWTARDLDRLAKIAGPDLLVEWKRRLDDFAKKGWHNRAIVSQAPTVRYVGMENRADDSRDTVVVAIDCVLDDFVVDRAGKVIKKNEEDDTQVRLIEYWTLVWTGEEWRIGSIQGEQEGRGTLEAPIVPVPEADEQQLRDQTVVELAVADALPEGAPAPGELVDVDYADDARKAALDLSLADGRFGPEVLDAAVRAVVPAWVAAVDGSDDALLRLSTPAAVRALLYPDPDHDRARLVIRGGKVEAIRIVKLDTSDAGARVTVEVKLRGRRYVEDRDTAAVLSGERDGATTSTQLLSLALDEGDPAVPWRLVGRGV